MRFLGYLSIHLFFVAAQLQIVTNIGLKTRNKANKVKKHNTLQTIQF